MHSSKNYRYSKRTYYCGTIIFRGGSMFVAFLGNLCPRIYIPRTYIQSDVLYLLKLSWFCNQRNNVPTNQENFGYPPTLTPMNIVYVYCFAFESNEKNLYLHFSWTTITSKLGTFQAFVVEGNLKLSKWRATPFLFWEILKIHWKWVGCLKVFYSQEPLH